MVKVIKISINLKMNKKRNDKVCPEFHETRYESLVGGQITSYIEVFLHDFLEILKPLDKNILFKTTN